MFSQAKRFARDARRARWAILGVALTAILANLATVAISGQRVFAGRCAFSPLCGAGGRSLLVVLLLGAVSATVVAVRAAFPVRSTKLEERSRQLYALVVPLSELRTPDKPQVSVTFDESSGRLTFTDEQKDAAPIAVPSIAPFRGQSAYEAVALLRESEPRATTARHCRAGCAHARDSDQLTWRVRPFRRTPCSIPAPLRTDCRHDFRHRFLRSRCCWHCSRRRNRSARRERSPGGPDRPGRDTRPQIDLYWRLVRIPAPRGAHFVCRAAQVQRQHRYVARDDLRHHPSPKLKLTAARSVFLQSIDRLQ